MQARGTKRSLAAEYLDNPDVEYPFDEDVDEEEQLMMDGPPDLDPED